MYFNSKHFTIFLKIVYQSHWWPWWHLECMSEWCVELWYVDLWEVYFKPFGIKQCIFYLSLHLAAVMHWAVTRDIFPVSWQLAAPSSERTKLSVCHYNNRVRTVSAVSLSAPHCTGQLVCQCNISQPLTLSALQSTGCQQNISQPVTLPNSLCQSFMLHSGLK